MLALATSGNPPASADEFAASSFGRLEIGIIRRAAFVAAWSVWHCLHVFRHSKSSASAVRSVTHCAGVSTRTIGASCFPVKSRSGSRTTRTSPGCAAIYSVNFFTRNACTTSALSCGTPSTNLLSNASEWHPAQAYANLTGAISSRPLMGMGRESVPGFNAGTASCVE